MAEYITRIRTNEGDKQIDYNSLANLPNSVTDGSNTVVSPNADYAEVGEWSDGNPGQEDRLGYFVAVAEVGDNTIKIRKATSIDDVRGVTVYNPAFSGNASADKYGQDGELLQQYNYVGVMGIVSIIDNGLCSVNGRCMPGDDGTAVPSTNNMGYAVLERVDDTHVLIAVEPGADMIQRVKTDVENLKTRLDIPTYDLTVLGLPTVPMDGTMVNAEIDTTDIMAAMDKGAIKVRVSITDEGVVSYGTAILNNIYLSGGAHFCSCPLVAGTMQMTFNLVVWGDRIEASFTDLSGGGSGASITVDAALSEGSENPVQNKVIAKKVREMDTAASGLTARVEALEKSGGGSGGTGGGGVSSWNDLTDKPFGEENAVIFEGVFQFEHFDSDEDGVSDMWTPMSDIVDNSDNTLVAGKVYTLTWDGAEYETECFEADGVLGIGNPVLIGGEDNGCPVVLARMLSEDEFGNIGWTALFTEPQTDLTISGRYTCKIELDEVKHLDNKYLAILDGEAGTETELLNESTDVTEYNQSFGAFCFYPFTTEETVTYWNSLEEGTIFVEFDGEVYECEPQRIAAFANAVAVGNCTAIGGTGNNEPFVVAVTGDEGPDGIRYYVFIVAALADTQSTTHTVRIWQGTKSSWKIKHEYQLEQPVSIDMSAFESEGKIVETYADGTKKTTVVELNGIGNPSKITDSNGNVIEFTW